MPHNVYATITDNEGVENAWLEVGAATVMGVYTDNDIYEFHITSGLVMGNNILEVYADDACGNVGEDTESVNFTCPDPEVWITAPIPDQLLCGGFTFTADTAFDRVVPEFTRVEFYIDGELIHTDTEGPEWTYDVNVNTFEPGSHLVSARARTTDMDGVHTWHTGQTINWVKNCPPVVQISLISIDIGEKILWISAAESTDDSGGPLTYGFECLFPPCDDCSIDQDSPTDPEVVITVGENCSAVHIRVEVTDSMSLAGVDFISIDFDQLMRINR